MSVFMYAIMVRMLEARSGAAVGINATHKDGQRGLRV